jgi:hypothetical protein
MALARLRYHPPQEDREYRPPRTAMEFSRTEVPPISHHRVVYLHTLHVVLEETPVGEFGEVWSAIADRLRDFHAAWPRVDLPSEHRQMLWTAYARVRSRLRNAEEEADFAALEALDLLPDADTPVTAYSVGMFWRALHFLRTAWNGLRYDKVLRAFVSAMVERCGDFFWETSDDRATFDFDLFVAQTSDGWRVTTDFFAETERVFYYLLYDLDAREKLEGAREIPELGGDPRARTAAWVATALDTPAIRTAVERTFKKTFLARRVFAADTERFEETERFETSDPYHIISKRSVREHDTLLLITDTPTVVADVLHIEAEARAFDPSARDAPEDARSPVFMQMLRADGRDATVLCAAALLDSAFSSADSLFLDFFVVKRVPEAEQRFPVVLHVFHEYHVWYKNTVILCPDALTAVHYWIVCMADDADALAAVASVAPNVEVFYDAYKACTGQTARSQMDAEAERAAQERSAGVDLRMPEHYSDG